MRLSGAMAAALPTAEEVVTNLRAVLQRVDNVSSSLLEYEMRLSGAMAAALPTAEEVVTNLRAVLQRVDNVSSSLLEYEMRLSGAMAAALPTAEEVVTNLRAVLQRVDNVSSSLLEYEMRLSGAMAAALPTAEEVVTNLRAVLQRVDNVSSSLLEYEMRLSGAMAAALPTAEEVVTNLRAVLQRVDNVSSSLLEYEMRLSGAMAAALPTAEEVVTNLRAVLQRVDNVSSSLLEYEMRLSGAMAAALPTAEEVVTNLRAVLQRVDNVSSSLLEYEMRLSGAMAAALPTAEEVVTNLRAVLQRVDNVSSSLLEYEMRLSGAMAAALPTAEEVVTNLRAVLQRVDNAYTSAAPERRAVDTPRLIAVSKTKPASLVLAAYNAGQRHFGENYPQELEEKGKELAETCPDIRWHFIGALQSNKIAGLVAAVPALHCVQTLASEKGARMLDAAAKKRGRCLDVMIQMMELGLNWMSVTLALSICHVLRVRMGLALAKLGLLNHLPVFLTTPSTPLTIAVSSALLCLSVMVAFYVPLPVLIVLAVGVFCPTPFLPRQAQQGRRPVEMVDAAVQVDMGQPVGRNMRPLSSALLARLPVFAFQWERDGPLDPCPVCLEEAETGTMLLHLPCSHSLHAAPCAANWLSQADTCPLCTLIVQLPSPAHPH